MPSPLELAILSVFVFLVTAAAIPFLSKKQSFLINVSFLVSAISSIVSAYAGFLTVYHGITDSIIIPIGLPELPFYLRVDPLSGFFLGVISLTGFFVSIYSLGYVKGFLGKRSVTPLAVFYSLFMAGMLLVTLADDAYSFMVSWELMAASSYFLVCFEDDIVENRRAAVLYLLIAHIGAVFILLAFG